MSYYAMHSGEMINISDFINHDQINLKDIAHHLSKICRFGGSLPLNCHYSVAQHSILLSHFAKNMCLSLDLQRVLLMHDATEAYLGDVVTGLKSHLSAYNHMETCLLLKIEEKYGLKFSNAIIWSAVNVLDKRILLDEVLAFMPSKYQIYKEQLSYDTEPLGVTPVNERNQEETYRLFLHYCDKLGIKD